MTIEVNCVDDFTLSLLTPSVYQLAFNKLPHIAFMCQHINLPEVSFGTAMAPYRTHDLKLPGEKLQYGPLSAEILIDKNMVTYTEIYNWMKDISVFDTPSKDWTSFASLIIGGKTFMFHDVYPTQVGSINFFSTVNDSPAVTFNVVFEYTYFDIN